MKKLCNFKNVKEMKSRFEKETLDHNLVIKLADCTFQIISFNKL